MNQHQISPAGTDTRDLSIRGLPFRVFGELGLKRRYAAVALPDAGARAKTEKKAAKSGQKWPRMMFFSNFYSLYQFLSLRPVPARAPKEGAKKCKKVQKSAEKCKTVPSSQLP
jgi:hypothetical protein